MINAILLLAGSSERFNSITPKQFIKIDGKELFLTPLFTFYKVEEIKNIVLVCQKERIDEVKSIVKKYLDQNIYGKRIIYAEGGKTRQESSFNGLKAIEPLLNKNEDNYVLIHDAARVLIDESIIKKNIEIVKKHDAVTTFLPIYDSIIETNETEIVKNYLNRDIIKQVQTPQSFKFDIIYKAHKKANKNYRDDASLIYEEKLPIYLVEGNRLNFKITTKDDLELLKLILKGKNG